MHGPEAVGYAVVLVAAMFLGTGPGEMAWILASGCFGSGVD
jgi:hypothetical protein